MYKMYGYLIYNFLRNKESDNGELNLLEEITKSALDKTRN